MTSGGTRRCSRCQVIRIKRAAAAAVASGKIGKQRRTAGLRALDREQAQLGAHAAWRRKSASFAARRHDAMARHDDRERILPERLRDIAGQLPVAQALGDFAVGQRRARRNGARDVVDAAVESPARRPYRLSLRSDPSALRQAARRCRRSMRCTSAGGTVSQAPGKRRRRRLRMACSLGSGNCTPAMPRAFQTMPQRPIAVSNSAKPELSHHIALRAGHIA